MPNYMIVYKGDATGMEDMTPEAMQGVMRKWEEWMGAIGPALVDVGSPFGEAASLLDNGTDGTAAQLSGYSIVAADDIDAAKALCKDHPFLSDDQGDFAIDLYEMMPAPM